MLCHWICSYTHTGDVSFEVEEDRSFRNLLLSPQCPVWRRPPVFVRKWSIVSSLFPPNEYFQSSFPRVPVDESGARLVIPAERQHEPPLEPTDAHAQLLSGWVDACTRSDFGMVSDGGKLYSKRHAILFREDKAWKSAAPCYSFPHYAVSAGLHKPISTAQ